MSLHRPVGVGIIKSYESFIRGPDAHRRPMPAPMIWLGVVVCGLLVGVAGAPRDLPAFAYVGFAGFAFLFARAIEIAPEQRAWRRGLALGWALGFAINGFALRFSVSLLIDFGHMPWPVAILLSALLWGAQGLVHAVAGCMVGTLAEHVDRPRRALFVYGLLPAALVLAEHVVPMIFPWRLAAALSSWLPMMQLADVGGEPLLTLLVAGFGCAFAASWESPARSSSSARSLKGPANTRVMQLDDLHPPTGGWRFIESIESFFREPEGVRGERRRLRFACAAIAAALLVVPFGYGVVRIAEIESARARAPRLRVGLVQPNIGIGDKGRDELAFDHWDSLADLTLALERRGAELVVWPETAAPFSMRRTMHREPEGAWSLLDRGVQGPVLMGVVTWHSIVRKHNSAILLRPDGTYSAPSDKLELIPFGEFTPFWEPIRDLIRAVWPTAPFRPFFERAKGFTPGEAPVLIRSPARLGILICYEDVLPAVGRRVFHADSGPPDLLVNMTNDAWFGDGDEPHLHLALSRFRAVETRRDLVRAVNTGVSAAVSATGEVTERTGTFVRTALLAETRLLSGTTPYMVLGDWVVSVALALIAALAVRAATATLRAGRVA